MSQSAITGSRIAGISTCVPTKAVRNADVEGFDPVEIRKIVSMAGVHERRVVADGATSASLCCTAAEQLIDRLNWERSSIDGLILVTQTPDYFLPSSSCVIHDRLELSTTCACFDVGLGCSGYPYGLWLAAMMVASGGHRRVLVLNGETPSLLTDAGDRATLLLFGDCGSATAVEASAARTPATWYFSLHTDGTGHEDLIVRGGGFKQRFDPKQRNNYLEMNGANIFRFTIKRVPPLIEETMALAGCTKEDIDYFVFHQANQYMIKHIMSKCGLPPEKVPLTIREYGNCGGPSVALALTLGLDWTNVNETLSLMLLGYGVGLSWGSALLPVDPDVVTCHCETG